MKIASTIIFLLFSFALGYGIGAGRTEAKARKIAEDTAATGEQQRQIQLVIRENEYARAKGMAEIAESRLKALRAGEPAPLAKK